MREQAKEMAKGGKSIAEEIATDVLDNGFTAGTGADGSYLYASAHNLINSGDTGDNAETVALDSDGLEAIQLLADGMVDETGQYVREVYDTLVVPIQLRREAEEIVGSDKTPENANNATNTYKGRYRVIVNQYLASTTAYYVCASSNGAENKPRFFWRVQPKFKMGYDVYSDNTLFKARERFVAGFTSYQHTVASTGVA